MNPAIRASLLSIAVILAAGTGCSDPITRATEWTQPSARPSLDPTYQPSGHAAAGHVFVHLFEWPWEEVATECEVYLGPTGYEAVQVSPPQEHAVLPGFPWWERYQPVSYSLERSRSGTADAFRNMVERCHAAGVDVYVDAILNHMTAGAGVGSNGTAYSKYAYPGLYDAGDFHAPCQVTDYQDAANVQDCELLGLADLDTGSESVRRRLADYLIALGRMGVAGFRLDAAKHIQPVELDSILALVNRAADAENRPRPYYFAEVIDFGGEAVTARDYFGLASSSGGSSDITEFRYRRFADFFKRDNAQPLAALKEASPTAWNLMPADKAVVFANNHDTQRASGTLDYRDAVRYRLAHVWLLAYPYGYPKVTSGYAFDIASQAGRDMGPPSGPGGETLPVACASSMEEVLPGGWVCEHRDPVISAMVAFRRAVSGTPVTGWWDDGGNAIAFSRGDQGFVAINLEPDSVTVSTLTPLPAGVYCDILTGPPGEGTCPGHAITVSETGVVEFRLPPERAVAIRRGVDL
ncbi:MAG: alpha-amylase family protein [Gemmatimonadota bacterium]